MKLFTHLTAVVFTAGIALASLGTFSPAIAQQEGNMNTVYELAINKVKEGKFAEFKDARATFITEMKKVEGAGIDGAFQSFFTMPGQNDTEVFIGITEWASMQDFGKAAEELMPTDAFKNYFQTFDQLAYVLLTPEDGKPFDVQTILKDGQVVEFAVRSVKEGQEGVFADKRKAFFDKVAEQKGYLFDREFVTVDGKARAVIIAWESMESFQQALGALSQLPEMGEFFSVLDVQAYQVGQLVQ